MAQRKKPVNKKEPEIIPKDREMSIRLVHDKISKATTSEMYVQKRPGPGGTTMDFVDEGYMRQVLNDNFPIWSWQVVKYDILENEVTCHGRLTISDDGALRSFDALSAHKIALTRAEGRYVDLGNDMKSANTEAFKVACNRLCNIADDVYRKSVLTNEQHDTLEGLLAELDGQTRRRVKESVGNHKINPSNFDSTMEKLLTIKEAKEKTNG